MRVCANAWLGTNAAALTLATVDDEAAEAASVLAVTVASGDGYTVASEGASAEVTVADDDAAPEVTSALALAVPENVTSVATLEATDVGDGQKPRIFDGIARFRGARQTG